MHRVRFGVATAGDDPVTHARRVEALGFDSYGVGEHLFFHFPTTNAFVALAAAAAATSTIGLMSTIALAPLYPPALLVKLAAAVDTIAEGRFELGLGVGGEHPPELEAVGVDPAERGARLDEAIALVRDLWTGAPVTRTGRFSRLTDARLHPIRRVGAPPTLWVAGRSRAAIHRAARSADGWFPYMVTPEQLAAGREELMRSTEAAGRDPQQMRVAVLLFTRIAHPGSARADTIRALRRNYRQDFAPLVDRLAVVGEAGACAERVAAYLDAGADTVLFASACTPEEVPDNEARIAGELLPTLRGSSE